MNSTNRSQQYQTTLGDKFELITAFSREGPDKVYVQHRLKERAKEVNELLEQKAYLYVCGDAANMAREVNSVLAQIIAEQRGIPETKGEEIVKNMRAANQYQVRNPSDMSLSSPSLAPAFQLALLPSVLVYRYIIDYLIANLLCRRMCGHDMALQESVAFLWLTPQVVMCTCI